MGTPVRPRPAPAARPAGRRARTWLADRDNWGLLPLRAFLGATFVFAGLQKLADRWFFKASAPSSLQSQLHAAARTSPIGGLVGSMSHIAVLVGLLIAVAELAIGIGTLLGLWARVAAAAGLLLSLGFLLTVSWHTRPYYYGADIVFVFAWTPLILAGAGRWSLDAWAAAEARSELGLAPLQPVTVDFAVVQKLCGAYDHGRCRAQKGQRCRQQGCPVLAAGTAERTEVEVDRRTFLQQAGLAGWLGSAALLSGTAVAIIGRLVSPRASRQPTTAPLQLATGGQGSASSDATTVPGEAPTHQPATSATQPATPTQAPATQPAATEAPATQPPVTQPPATQPPSSAAPPAGTAIGPASSVPVGGAARFTDPSTGDPAFVLQPRSGSFVAFDAICTHQGCTVEYAGPIFQCPCHGAQFDATTGQVVRGPATRPLGAIPIQRGGNGDLYVG